MGLIFRVGFRYLQNVIEERREIILDDGDKTLHDEVIDEGSKVAQLLQNAIGVCQVPLQRSQVSLMQMHGLATMMWQFGIGEVLLKLLEDLVTLLFGLKAISNTISTFERHC